MAYTTVDVLREYLGLTASDDDGLLEVLIQRAQTAIDTATGRTFEAGADATRRFSVGDDTEGSLLILDADLCQITSIITDADGSSPVTLATTDYITHPRNRTPYYAIRLRSDSDEDWDYTNAAEMGITITGRWAYSLTAPADVQQACIRLASWYYRQKDSSNDLDRPILTGDGVTVMPSSVPHDVQAMIKHYRRAVL
jgi:hypothetical protein